MPNKANKANKANEANKANKAKCQKAKAYIMANSMHKGMPKAGTYDYPSRDLDDCVDSLRKARNTAQTQIMNREIFAGAIGMSATGGGFGILIGSMADYGLVETGGGQIKITDLGEKILFGEPEEQRKSKELAVRKVLLFTDIFERFKGLPTDEQLRIFLRDKANVDISEANRLAFDVGKLLKKNSQYLTSTSSGGGSEIEHMTASEAINMIGRLETTEYGILNIKDQISMDLAITLLTQIKKAKGWGENVIKLYNPNGEEKR